MTLPIYAEEYHLVQPGTFKRVGVQIDRVPRGHTVLQTLYTAICGSDLHYFAGEKSEKKLQTRLPLILLHEGVCQDLKTGKRVVPMAGDFRAVPRAFNKKENMWPQLPYLGSTMPGLARTHLVYPEKLILQLPPSIPDTVASLVEPLSIALKSGNEMAIKKNEQIAIIGTGGIAFLLAVALRYYFQIPRKNLAIWGVHDDKLDAFKTLAHTVNYTKEKQTETHAYTKVFEAVGQKHMHQTMQMAMQLVKPGGAIGVLGLSEKSWELPIEQLVNQQITVKGLTRSTPNEYKQTIRLLQNPTVSKIIEQKLIWPRVFCVHDTADIHAAFEFAKSPRANGRILLKWTC